MASVRAAPFAAPLPREHWSPPSVAPQSTEWHPFATLLALDRIEDPELRRAAFRAALAELAARLADRRTPAPLEGLDPHALEAGLARTLAEGALANLEWVAPDLAQPALYAIASALPAGESKRAIGRRVLASLRSGDTSTFVSVATQLVLSSSAKWLHEPAMRARVVLALELPLWADSRIDSLALALLSRRELVDAFLEGPSTGSLASRRLAARLLERASREAARRATEGDDSGVRLFETEDVDTAMRRLLADRESLVWRSVAVARGQLSLARSRTYEDILADLDPALGMTQWRRAAVALAASAIVRPEESVRACLDLCQSQVPRMDAGIGAAIVHGLVRAAGANAPGVDRALVVALSVGGLDAVEAIVEGRREIANVSSAHPAFDHALSMLDAIEHATSPDDEGRIALARALRREIEDAGKPIRDSLVARFERALEALEGEGTAAASFHAAELVRAADGVLDELVALDVGTREGRTRSFELVRELDVTLLETDLCANLAIVAAKDDRPERADGSEPVASPVARVVDRFFGWLASQERQEPADQPFASADVFLRMRRLRAFLHLVDSDAGSGPRDVDASVVRRGDLLHDLLRRVAHGAPALRRVLAATSARLFDAMVRRDAVDAADVVLTVSRVLERGDDVRMLAEGVMTPELERALEVLATAFDVGAESPRAAQAMDRRIARIVAVARVLPVASSTRVEALRAGLFGAAEVLGSLATIASVRELTDPDASGALHALRECAVQLAQLESGSARRLGGPQREPSAFLDALSTLPLVCERAVHGLGSPDDLRASLSLAWERAPFCAPVDFALAALAARIPTLPLDSARARHTIRFSHAPIVSALPGWMPVHRSLGGFFIQRALGGGSAGSVFVARRSEDRHVPAAETFALKVPEYDSEAARTLSESEFLSLFREEAAALLALPRHANIARFVTFDAGARPKPFLVMELVEGESLEHVITLGRLTMPRAFELLEGIASGLEAMHSVGVAHLDLKPSNVIVRRAEDGSPEAAVLVDFGLAGRRVRPGCGTANYGANEVWRSRAGDAPRATPVDVYAFACVAYETFTGRTLFESDDTMELISLHASHDGDLPKLAELAAVPGAEALAAVLGWGLRFDPERRATIAELRGGIGALRSAMAGVSWPVGR